MQTGALRLAALTAAITVVAAIGCKKVERANGEVTRNWTPPQQDAYMGVPATEVRSATTRGRVNSVDDWSPHAKP